jgi:hypothetical protein
MKSGSRGMPPGDQTREDVAVTAEALRLTNNIQSAERHALWQRVLVYPAAQRVEVLRQSAQGTPDTLIAEGLLMPLSDVRLILQAFNQLAAADPPATDLP